MTLTEQVAKKIIKKLLQGQDYRVEIITLINAQFLQFAIDFFKKIVDAKLNNQDVTIDWYKKEFIHPKLPKNDVAINSGLNMKTIGNMFNSTKKEVVINASIEHYDTLYDSIKTLVDSENELELKLTIKFKSVSVELNISESLIVINTLAVKRAALRGGLWSTAGKRVEKPLMETLCRLYEVPRQYYKAEIKGRDKKKTFQREIDFYLIGNNTEYKCEVKLMGKGNPESADAVIARDSKVFIADKLSDTNKAQLDSLSVEWVELRSKNGFHKFQKILEHLKIPFKNKKLENLDKRLDCIFCEIF